MRLVDVVRRCSVDEMTEGLDVVVTHWPVIGMVGAVLFCAYLGTRTLALTVDWIGDALGPLGKFWRSRRTISRAEIDDLQRRITYLDSQVRALRYRDEVYAAFTLLDQQYHHRLELLAVENGWKIDRHVSFLEFRDRWMKDHGLDSEALEIWQ